MATTAQNICDRAYRKIGLSSPSAAESTLAFESLNDMISLWGTIFLVPYRTRENLVLTVDQAEYTIGKEGTEDFDTIRPMRIRSVYLTDSDDYSYSVKVISDIDYNKIASKTLSGRPTKVYYINEYPSAKIIFNKETDIAYTAHFEFWKNFTEFAAITTEVSFPNEYKDAMVYNLAVRLAEDNSIELPRSVGRYATSSLVLIKRLLASNRRVPRATFDFADGSIYDIETDI